MRFWVIGGILVLVVCLVSFINMVRKAPMDTDIWGPDGEPQPKRGWDRNDPNEWGQR